MIYSSRHSLPQLIALISANYQKSMSVLICSKLRKSCILAERPPISHLIIIQLYNLFEILLLVYLRELT